MKSRAQEAAEAINEGKRRFISENPCARCGCVDFYSSSRGACVDCKRRKMAEFTSTPEGRKKMSSYVISSRKRRHKDNPELKEQYNQSVRDWRATERGSSYMREYNKAWAEKNILNVSIRRTLRRMFISMTKEYAKRTDAEIVGYDCDDFLQHLLKTAPSIDRVISGEYHVDHILPINWFILNSIYDQRIINALANLQAIPKIDNLSKGSKWLNESMTEWEWCYLLQIGVYGEIKYQEKGA